MLMLMRWDLHRTGRPPKCREQKQKQKQKITAGLSNDGFQPPLHIREERKSFADYLTV